MEKKYTDFTEYRKVQTARILSNYKETDELIKAYDEQKIEKSEGSRGGKVIGHTKSGKPIYESGNHSHLMTKQDYLDASNKHALIAADKNHEYGIGGFSKEQLAAKAAAKHHEHQANYLQGEADNFVERPDSFNFYLAKEKKVNDKKDLSKMSVEEHDKEIDRLQEIRNNRYIRNDKYNDEDKKANDEAFEQQKIHISHKNALLSKQEDSKRGEVGKVEKSESTDLSKAFETLGI